MDSKFIALYLIIALVIFWFLLTVSRKMIEEKKIDRSQVDALLIAKLLTTAITWPIIVIYAMGKEFFGG